MNAKSLPRVTYHIIFSFALRTRERGLGDAYIHAIPFCTLFNMLLSACGHYITPMLYRSIPSVHDWNSTHHPLLIGAHATSREHGEKNIKGNAFSCLKDEDHCLQRDPIKPFMKSEDSALGKTRNRDGEESIHKQKLWVYEETRLWKLG